MRREGYELQVSKPEVIIKEIDGVRREPVERVQIDVPEEHTGSVMESMGARKGEMLDMINNGNGQVRLIFTVPSRGLIGYSTEFLSLTRGFGILNHTFDSYQPMQKAKSEADVRVCSFPWKTEKRHLTEFKVLKTAASSSLSPEQKYMKA